MIITYPSWLVGLAPDAGRLPHARARRLDRRLPQTRAGLTCQEQLVDQPAGVGEQGNEFQPSPFGEPERQGSVMDREEFLCGRAA